MAGRDIRALLDEIDEIPTLPQVAVTLMELLDDPRTSAADINRIMARDPALAAKILKPVNSSYYGLEKKVASIAQAVVLLGFKSVRSIALSASVMGLFKSPGNGSVFEGAAFWKHSIAAACAAKIVARKQRGCDPETAFTAALLHDLGKLVLSQYFTADLTMIIQAAEIRRRDFADVEKDYVDTGHAEIGRWMTQRWGLPEVLSLTIGAHHDISQAPDASLAAVVQFADYLAKMKGMAAPGTFCAPSLANEVWPLLRISPDDLPEVVEAINTEISAASSWLEVAA